MFTSPHTIRFVKALALAAALAAVMVPAAQAAEKPDAEHRYLGTGAAADVGSPERIFAGQYGISRALPSHYEQAGVELVRQSGTPRAMPSDYAAAGIGPTLVAVPGGFDWGDATFGVGMTAAALLLAGAIAIGIRQRKRVALS